ncbi:MAG: two-component system sensor histidine kinase/response regulator [Limisphaerales bacterium]|jgi:two-component system sensor histidine kinase/response regulator
MKPTPDRPCLLLVDDTPANIAILVDLLNPHYDLKIATRGAQALQICAQAERIDLILLDVMMPEMDGYEVCQTLRSNPGTQNIPVIFLTAKTEVENIVRAFEVGANDYVSKPFHPAEVMARVRTHLMVRAQQLEIEKQSTELKEMLHIVCHDVANHFTVLNAALYVIASGSEMELQSCLPRMAAATRNGIALTTLVQVMQETEEKGLPLQPVALGSTVAESILIMEGRIQDKELQVLSNVPEVNVEADICALTNSVIGNILSNAIKFSHQGGLIEINALEEDDMVCITIQDHGIGMPDKTLTHLFDVTKSHSRPGTAGEKGTGFGMPLMRKFVTMFGGTVDVETREAENHPEDHGTAFIIRLKKVG